MGGEHWGAPAVFWSMDFATVAAMFHELSGSVWSKRQKTAWWSQAVPPGACRQFRRRFWWKNSTEAYVYWCVYIYIYIGFDSSQITQIHLILAGDLLIGSDGLYHNPSGDPISVPPTFAVWPTWNFGFCLSSLAIEMSVVATKLPASQGANDAFSGAS